MQKQLEGTRSILMSSANELPISMGNSCNYCEQYTRASARYKCLKVIKPSNPFTICWVSVSLTFSAPQNLAASTVFLLQFENEEMMGDGFLWCYCCRFVLNSKRLCGKAHPVISRASAVAVAFFHGVIQMLFGSSPESYVQKIKQALNNELKFPQYVVCMSGAMNRHYIPGLTMSTALTGNFSAGVSGIIKTMHTGFKHYVLHYTNAPVLTRKKPDVMIQRGKICVVLDISIINELSKVQ